MRLNFAAAVIGPHWASLRLRESLEPSERAFYGANSLQIRTRSGSVTPAQIYTIPMAATASERTWLARHERRAGRPRSGVVAFIR